MNGKKVDLDSRERKEDIECTLGHNISGAYSDKPCYRNEQSSQNKSLCESGERLVSMGIKMKPVKPAARSELFGNIDKVSERRRGDILSLENLKGQLGQESQAEFYSPRLLALSAALIFYGAFPVRALLRMVLGPDSKMPCSTYPRRMLLGLFFAITCISTCSGDGPQNPSTNPAVLARMLPANVFTGGPFSDFLEGPRIPGQVNFFFGKDGSDQFDTQLANDYVFGGDGDDQIYLENGNDTCVAGPGNDLVIGGPGRDFIWGGPGDDTIDGDPCGSGNVCEGPGIVYDDHIQCGPGNDVAIGRRGNDEIWGEGGNDKLLGNGGSDIIRGGDGNDDLSGDGKNENGPNDFDDVRGGPGNDTVYGGLGSALLYGEAGFDILRATPGGKTTFVLDAQPCGEWDDVRYFNPATDSIVIVTGTNALGISLFNMGKKAYDFRVEAHLTQMFISGCAKSIAHFGYGVDPAKLPANKITLSKTPPPSPSWMVGQLPEPVPGRNGIPPVPPDDVMQGTPTTDILYGAERGPTWTNYIFGGDLNDTLHGASGPDFILGGNHNDSIFGGDGDDVIDGGAGYDVIWGQGGRDALFGSHNSKVMYGGGWGNWMTGSDGQDDFYVDAPASCRATGPFPDIINNFDGPFVNYPQAFDKLWIVGGLTNIGQLTITENRGAAFTNIYLKGCSLPFITVKYVKNNKNGAFVSITASNLRFTTLARVPKGACNPSFLKWCNSAALQGRPA